MWQKLLKDGLSDVLSDIRNKDDCDENCKNFIFNFFGDVQKGIGSLIKKFTKKVFKNAAETLIKSRLYERFKPRHNCVQLELENDGFDKFCSNVPQLKVIHAYQAKAAATCYLASGCDHLFIHLLT